MNCPVLEMTDFPSCGLDLLAFCARHQAISSGDDPPVFVPILEHIVLLNKTANANSCFIYLPVIPTIAQVIAEAERFVAILDLKVHLTMQVVASETGSEEANLANVIEGVAVVLVIDMNHVGWSSIISPLIIGLDPVCFEVETSLMSYSRCWQISHETACHAYAGELWTLKVLDDVELNLRGKA